MGRRDSAGPDSWRTWPARLSVTTSFIVSASYFLAWPFFALPPSSKINESVEIVTAIELMIACHELHYYCLALGGASKKLKLSKNFTIPRAGCSLFKISSCGKIFIEAYLLIIAFMKMRRILILLQRINFRRIHEGNCNEKTRIRKISKRFNSNLMRFVNKEISFLHNFWHNLKEKLQKMENDRAA